MRHHTKQKVILDKLSRPRACCGDCGREKDADELQPCLGCGKRLCRKCLSRHFHYYEWSPREERN